MLLVATGEITGAPWTSRNIEKYVSDETQADTMEIEKHGDSVTKRKSGEELAGDKERRKK